MARSRYQRVTGMQDILPETALYWRYVLSQAQAVMDKFGYQKIDTPLLEAANLFTRSVGAGTDIVEKEMYTFEDRDGDMLALRPEFTAGVMRLYVENGMHTYPTPLKLWTAGPLFRHEKNQLGRYRQHSQLNLEVLGEEDALVDAELINAAWTLFSELGIKELSLFIHSTGDPVCRPKYVQALVDYFSQFENQLPEDDKRRLAQNPLRILDTKEQATQALFDKAPRFIDYLSSDCIDHFEKLQAYLSAFGIPYQVDYKLVRGFDYYTKTVFEIKASGSLGAQDVLCGGGRYDGLIEQVGGRPTPGVGFGSGIERIILTMQAQKIEAPAPAQPLAFIAYLGEGAKREGIKLVSQLRQDNIPALIGTGDRSLKSQMKSANRSQAQYAIIIGENELAQGQATVRNLVSKKQEDIVLGQLLPWLKAKS